MASATIMYVANAGVSFARHECVALGPTRGPPVRNLVRYLAAHTLMLNLRAEARSSKGHSRGNPPYEAIEWELTLSRSEDKTMILISSAVRWVGFVSNLDWIAFSWTP